MRVLRRIALGVSILFAVVVVAVLGAGLTYRPASAAPPSLGGAYVEVMGHRVRYQQWGNGPDVLLIHGSPGSLEDWAALSGELAKTHRVTAYDRSGQGYSEPSGTTATYQHHAEVALALIEALKLHDLVIVGHSYGGATALAIAVGHPPAVRGYVVVDSTVYPRAAKVDVLYEVLALPVVGVGVARLVGSFVGRRKLRAGIDQGFRGARPPEGFYALREEIWLQPKVNHALADERVHADASLRELSAHYAEIAAPLVIVGQAEDPDRRVMLERLHGDVRGSQLTLVPGTGHYIQFQRPDAIAAAIDAVSSRATPDAR